jgi:hypothetical protein
LQKAVQRYAFISEKQNPRTLFFFALSDLALIWRAQSTKKPHHDPSSGGDAVQNAYI